MKFTRKRLHTKQCTSLNISEQYNTNISMTFHFFCHCGVTGSLYTHPINLGQIIKQTSPTIFLVIRALQLVVALNCLLAWQQ